MVSLRDRKNDEAIAVSPGSSGARAVHVNLSEAVAANKLGLAPICVGVSDSVQTSGLEPIISVDGENKMGTNVVNVDSYNHRSSTANDKDTDLRFTSDNHQLSDTPSSCESQSVQVAQDQCESSALLTTEKQKSQPSSDDDREIALAVAETLDTCLVRVVDLLERMSLPTEQARETTPTGSKSNQSNPPSCMSTHKPGTCTPLSMECEEPVREDGDSADMYKHGLSSRPTKQEGQSTLKDKHQSMQRLGGGGILPSDGCCSTQGMRKDTPKLSQTGCQYGQLTPKQMNTMSAYSQGEDANTHKISNDLCKVEEEEVLSETSVNLSKLVCPHPSQQEPAIDEMDLTMSQIWEEYENEEIEPESIIMSR